MLKRLAKYALFAALLIAPSLVYAQVRQSGSVTNGHIASWTTSGVIQDAGSSASPNAITSFGIINNGNCGISVNSAAVTGAYNQLCLGANTSAASVLSLQNYGGAAAQGLNIIVNGTTALGINSAGSISFPPGTISVGSLAPMAANTVVANATSGTASPTAATVSALLDSAVGATQGDMMFRNATGWVALGPGANGACLTAQGAASNLVWGSCAGSGGTGTVTSVATSTGLTGGTITTTGTIALASAAANTIKSNITSGSAAPIDNTLTNIIDADIGTTRGAILERGASTWGLLAPSGTAQTIFASNGSGSDPTYQTLTAIIDSAIGSTRGAILERGASGWQIVSPGTAGQVWASNGSGTDPSYQAVPSAPPWPSTTNNVVTSTGSVTIPTGATRAYVRLCGGGGAGGAGGATVGAGGGGAGACAEQYLQNLTAGLTLTATIGAAGAGGAGNGGNGGATSLASNTQTITTISANGGNGGAAESGGPGVGGAAQSTTSGAAVAYPGGSGDDGATITGGRGADSRLGSGGGGSLGACKLGTNYGSGGSGSVSGNGCSGSQGVVIIQWYS